jgi:hypothetical protein
MTKFFFVITKKIIIYLKHLLDMLNIFSLKQARPGDGASSDPGTKKTSAALLRVTKGY